jgi:NAD(P)H-dependent FMN reductase
MKITIIVASQRKDSQSKRVGEYIQKTLTKRHEESITTNLICLGEKPLPFFDDRLEENMETQESWSGISTTLKSSDCAIFITPEWGGMAAPALKNFCLYLTDELLHKPVLLVSVTASPTNGAYPITDMRAASYKNNHICYLPDHLIVRSVEKCFLDEIAIETGDIKIRERIDWTTVMLLEYAKALKEMRKNSSIDYARYSFYGM